tara:strand:- start:121 stop:225 length:105 start_codon:yes stop_codon:yes gene_type:complete
MLEVAEVELTQVEQVVLAELEVEAMVEIIMELHV